MKIPVYIISYNRVSTLKAMVEYLRTISNLEIIICDNNSTYPPLLEWLDRIDVQVVRLTQNMKHVGPWISGTVALDDEHRSRYDSEWYVVTDCDLDLSGCPKDLVIHLIDGLLKYPDYVKVGVSLEINDIPDYYVFKNEVIEWEKQFWQDRVGDYYKAGVDTTFAVYECSANPLLGHNGDFAWNCLRADRPYTARHLPWYLNLSDLDEEELYYLRSLGEVSSWSKKHLAFIEGNKVW